jgi:O-antigen/teichoic acid export membrane protein
VIPVIGAALLVANMYIFVPGVFLVRRTDIVAVINVAAAVLSIAANLVLIPRFGIEGAACAMLLASAVAFGCYLHYNQIYYPIALAGKRLAAALAFTAAAGALLMALQHRNGYTAAMLPLKLALWMAACLICAAMVLPRVELRLAVRRVLGKGAA